MFVFYGVTDEQNRKNGLILYILYNEDEKLLLEWQYDRENP